MRDLDPNALARLAADLERADWPAPEMLARYATAPNTMPPAEREAVEAALAATPALRDELETLRAFDVAALEPAASSATPPAATGRGRAASRWGLALAAALAGLAFWWISGPALGPDVPAPRSAEGPSPKVVPVPGVPTAPEDRARYAETDPGSAPSSPTGSPSPQPDVVPPESSAPDPSAIAREDTVPAPDPAPLRDAEGTDGAPPEAYAATEAPASDSSAPAPARDADRASALEPERVETLLAVASPVYTPSFGLGRPEVFDVVVRGAGTAAPRVTVVAPDHVTRVTTASPRLHWSVAPVPSAGRFVLTVLDEDENVVALDVALPDPARDGRQTADLEALGVTLPEDVVLRWSVAWRPEAEAPPAAFDFGWIRFLPLSAEDRRQLDASAPGDRPAFLALRGGFHEALAAADDIVRTHPDAPTARAAVAGLLDQVPSDARPSTAPDARP